MRQITPVVKVISNQYSHALIIYGTPEQIDLLVKICESLKYGTFVEDMRVVLGLDTGHSLVVAYGAKFWQQHGVTTGTPPDTTPTPSLAFSDKSGALDNSPQQAGEGVRPDSALPAAELPGTAGADPFSGEGTL
jgi:hypothetical protein